MLKAIQFYREPTGMSVYGYSLLQCSCKVYTEASRFHFPEPKNLIKLLLSNYKELTYFNNSFQLKTFAGKPFCKDVIVHICHNVLSLLYRSPICRK